jgi:hypothetical protein
MSQEEEWLELRRKQRARSILDQRHRLTQLEQAEVWAKRLTQDIHWNVFLQCLQALRNRSVRELEEAEAVERGTADFSYEGMAKRQAHRACIQTRILTLDEVLELPRDIMEEGAIARELLKKAETAA